MRLVRRSAYVTEANYSRYFEYPDRPGAGLRFDCDANGNVDVAALGACARDSYAACVAGAVDDRPVVDRGVECSARTRRVPAVGACDRCGRRVTLAGFTNTCACGADYNSAGQRLAPRAQWGEETGESVADVLSVDYRSTDDLLEGTDG
jgi:hypothetical protein